MLMNRLVNILARIFAVFVASALEVIGSGAILGIGPLKAASLAGLVAVSVVVSKLARSFMKDGNLSIADTNEAFSMSNVGEKTVKAIKTTKISQ